MNEGKYFSRGKVQELKAELALKKDSKKVLGVLKKIVANMTMGNDMAPLFKEVLDCLEGNSTLEIKKMVLLFLVSYARKEPELTKSAVSSLARDAQDPNPLIRALALKTVGNLPIDLVADRFCPLVKKGLKDRDPYVVKTAVLAISKIYFSRPELVRSEGLLSSLESLLDHENATVISNVVAVLIDISGKAQEFDLVIDYGTANKLLSVIEECSEWGQIHLLEAVTFVVPVETQDAEILAERVVPRLQHSNSAIVLMAVRVILYLTNYVSSEEKLAHLYKKLGPPMVTLLHGMPEIQFIALKNITIILQAHPNFLRNDIKVFFCKYNDPIYVKLAKLELLCRLVVEDTIDLVLPELKEYASEVDIEFVRKTVRSIGRCAIKIEAAADKCVQALVELIQTRVSYVVQEAVAVLKDIFRRYPNKYESVIGSLCENLDDLSESEAKASMIWIIGHYADRIDNAGDLLSGFLETFKEELPVVQLNLLTAIVKLFIRRPAVGQALVPKVLQYSTDDVDNPDLRDRGFMYWRLLSTNPVAAKTIVFSERSPILNDTENLDPTLLNELLLNLATLASVYLKTPGMIVGGLKPRLLAKSGAFVDRFATKQTTEKNNELNTEQYSLDLQEEKFMGADDTVQHQPMPSQYADLLDTVEDEIPDFPITYDSLRSAGAYTPSENVNFAQIGNQNPFGGMGTASTMYYGNAGTAPAMVTLPNFAVNNISNLQRSMQGVPAQPQIQTIPVQPSPYNPFTAHSSQPVIPIQPHSEAHLPHSRFVAAPPLSVITKRATGGPQNTSPTSPPYGKPVAVSDVMLDPFSKTSGTALHVPSNNAPTRNNAPVNVNTSIASPLQRLSLGQSSQVSPIENTLPSLSMQNVIFLEKSLFLSAQDGRGLEISGSFALRHSVMFLDLTFANKALQPLTDFSILFNTNSFSLCHAQPLKIDYPLLPAQHVEVSLPLKLEGLAKPASPINNLQVAVKCNAGIVYFQALVPLHILFNAKGNITPEHWLQLWSADIPQSNEDTFSINNLSLQSKEQLINKLTANSVYIIAERVIDEILVIYVSTNVSESNLFLSELRLDKSLRVCSVATKTASKPLVALYHASIETILRH